MKFGKQFHRLSPPSFTPFNISYQTLKQAIPVIIGDAEYESGEQTAKQVLQEFGPQAVGSSYRPPETRFNALLVHELSKVERCIDIHVQTWLDEIKEVLKQGEYDPEKLGKLAQDLDDMEVFRRLNFTAFRKITKKFDKMVKNRVAEGGFGKWFMQRLNQQPCFTRSFDWMIALLDVGYKTNSQALGGRTFEDGHSPSTPSEVVRKYWLRLTARTKVLTTLAKHLNIDCSPALQRMRDQFLADATIALPQTAFSTRHYAAYIDDVDFSHMGEKFVEWNCALGEASIRAPTEFEVVVHLSDKKEETQTMSRVQCERVIREEASKGCLPLAVSRSQQFSFSDAHGSTVVLDEKITFAGLASTGNVFDEIWNLLNDESEKQQNSFPCAVLSVRTQGTPTWLTELNGMGVLREVNDFDLGHHIAAVFDRSVNRPHWFGFLPDFEDEEIKPIDDDRGPVPVLVRQPTETIMPLYDDIDVMRGTKVGMGTAQIYAEPTYPLIEPKAFLANERTFISWTRIFVFLFTISLGLMEHKRWRAVASNPLVAAFPFVLMVMCIAGTIFCLRMFWLRHQAIRRHGIVSSLFCNPRFPAVVTISMCTALIANALMKVPDLGI